MVVVAFVFTCGFLFTIVTQTLVVVVAEAHEDDERIVALWLMLALTLVLPSLCARLGHLWDANLEKHQPAIKEMLARAQGEMGLEQFLAEACRNDMQIIETWQ